MRFNTSKIVLSALAAAVLLSTTAAGDAAAQTRQKPVEMKPATPMLKLKPQKRGGGSGGGVQPTGPAIFKNQDPVALPDFQLLAGLLGSTTQGLPNQGFCKRKGPHGEADTVAFKVKFATQGSTPPASGWGQTRTKVIFKNGGSVIVPMGQPAWDGTQAFEVAMPAGCYSAGTCQFTIQVDDNNVLPETSNANNSTTTSCVQPQG